MLIFKFLKTLCLAVLFFPFVTAAQKSVLTQHNDLERTGWYDQETILNKNNVKPGSFGKIFTRSTDDQIYAQPLVKMKLPLPGKGTKDVVFVATVNNTVYAFDADSAAITEPYWQVSLTAPGCRPVKNSDMTGACGGNYRDFSGNMGIVGTPVIDSTTNTLYVVARSMNPSTGVFMQYLHALDIMTGAEKTGSPVKITASVNGTGDGSINGVVTFDPQKQNQRPGLLLSGGTVYIAWASHCDWGPYHGWVMGFDKTSLQRTYIYCTTPDGYNGGIWMSGGAPAADENGNVYVASGNGSAGSNGDITDLRNRSESALQLSPGLTVRTFFTPRNYEALEAADLDFGVTEMMLLPHTDLVLTSCKDGHIYLMNRDSMGGYHDGGNDVVQDISLGIDAHLRSSFAYYKGESQEYAYSWSENALLKALPFDRATHTFDLDRTISSGIQGPTGNNGAFLSVSSDGSLDSTAILWASHAENGDANQSVRPGILRAIDATDVTKELWNSSQYSGDDPGNYAKFSCPTICNGKVYLATFSGQLVVYGLIASNLPDTCDAGNVALQKPVNVSSTANGGSGLSAVDGDLQSGWTSNSGNNEFISVDLQGRFDFCKIVLHWGDAYAADFSMDVSEDSISWVPLLSVTQNTGTDNTFSIHQSGRYVRINCLSGPLGYYILNELEVYARPSAHNCGTVSGLSVTNIYESSAQLHWNAAGAAKFNIQYKTVSAGDWTTLPADSTTYTLEGLSCATDYLFRVQGVCAADSGDFSTSASFSTLSCDADCGALPTRWTTQDIGDVGIAGSACYANGIYELHGSGDDIWDTRDAFRFAYKTVVGDGEITARVVTMDATNDWNKCGIMFRETLTPGSKHAFAALTSGNGVAFQDRVVTDGFSDNNNEPGITAPQWLKLQKKGSVYTAYYSADGHRWTAIGAPIDAGFGVNEAVYAGIALTSHMNNVLSTATVDNYAFNGIVDIALQSFVANVTLEKTVSLQWITTIESNVVDFIVERSTDNVNFVPIDTILATNNGSYIKTYDDEDKQPSAGYNYYRLRITNVYGTTSYSATVPVFISGSAAPFLFPNPAKGSVHIAMGSDDVLSVTIYDISGHVVRRVYHPGSLIEIPVAGLANAMYVVEIRTGSTVYRKKLVVHN